MSTDDPFSVLVATADLARLRQDVSSSGSATVEMVDRAKSTAPHIGTASEIQMAANSTDDFPKVLQRIEYTIDELKRFRDDLALVICNLVTMKDHAGGTAILYIDLENNNLLCAQIS